MTTKKKLRGEIRMLKDDNMRCFHRVRILERGVQDFLDAEKQGEMGTLEKAIEHLRYLVEQI